MFFLKSCLCKFGLLSMMVYSLLGCTQSNGGKKDGPSAEVAGTESNGGVAKIYVPAQSEEDPLIVEEGAVVASDVAGSYLHLPQGVVAAGPSVNVKAKEDIAPGEIFKIRLTIALDSGHALTTVDLTNLVVLYQVQNSKGETIYGLIPRKELTVAEDSVSFLLRGFGNYQAALLPELVEEEVVSEPTTVPILTAEVVTKLPLVHWSRPTGTFQESGRSVTLSATFSPAEVTMLNCVAVLDENKDSVFDHGASTGAILERTFPIAKQSGHTVYGFFECIDVNGRLSRSDWSHAIAVPAIPAPYWASVVGSVDALTGSQLNLSLDAVGAASYTLNLAAMDCDSTGGFNPSVSIDVATGLVTGTPSAAGQNCTVSVSATNAGGTITQTFVVSTWNHPGNICDTNDGTNCIVSSSKALGDLSLVKVDGNLIIENSGLLTAGVDETIAIDAAGSIEVRSGGRISANLSHMRATDIDIQTGGIVDADGLSTFTGELYAGNLSPTGQGAPHGGNGGDDTSFNVATAYGLASQPITSGAKGEPGTGGDGGNGGGAIKMIAAATLTIAGSVSATGGDGVSAEFAGGGGSGGSIWLIGNLVTGNGSVVAGGGDGGSASVADSGAGGAGGRIAIYAQTNTLANAPLVPAGFGGTTSGPVGGDGVDGSVQTFALSSLPGSIVFNSSMTYAGNLGGLVGADSHCQAIAEQSGLQGRWLAILSDGGVAAKDRLRLTGGVYDRDGQEIAGLAANLWTGGLSNSVARTEAGAVTTNEPWTGSLSDGRSSLSHCANWTSSAASSTGVVGDYTAVNGAWLNAAEDACNQMRSLYCINQ